MGRTATTLSGPTLSVSPPNSVDSQAGTLPGQGTYRSCTTNLMFPYGSMPFPIALFKAYFFSIYYFIYFVLATGDQITWI